MVESSTTLKDGDIRLELNNATCMPSSFHRMLKMEIPAVFAGDQLHGSVFFESKKLEVTEFSVTLKGHELCEYKQNTVEGA